MCIHDWSVKDRSRRHAHAQDPHDVTERAVGGQRPASESVAVDVGIVVELEHSTTSLAHLERALLHAVVRVIEDHLQLEDEVVRDELQIHAGTQQVEVVTAQYIDDASHILRRDHCLQFGGDLGAAVIANQRTHR